MDIDLNQLKQLIAIAENANIGQLELTDGEQRISITCQPPILTLYPIFAPCSGLTDIQHSPPQMADESTTPLKQPTHGDNNNNPDNLSNQAHAKQTTDSIIITSPMVGTFYRSAEPQTPALVNEGDEVAAGDTLCIIEAMKILHEVKAEQAGTIRHIAVNDQDMVEYGQTLFELQPLNGEQ